MFRSRIRQNSDALSVGHVLHGVGKNAGSIDARERALLVVDASLLTKHRLGRQVQPGLRGRDVP